MSKAEPISITRKKGDPLSHPNRSETHPVSDNEIRVVRTTYNALPWNIMKV